MGQGIVGVAANPISGALDFMSSAFEGMDASSAALLKRARAAEAQRARLPRAIAGDKRLLPFLRPDGNGMMTDKQVSACSSYGSGGGAHMFHSLLNAALPSLDLNTISSCCTEYTLKGTVWDGLPCSQ